MVVVDQRLTEPLTSLFAGKMANWSERARGGTGTPFSSRAQSSGDIIWACNHLRTTPILMPPCTCQRYKPYNSLHWGP